MAGKEILCAFRVDVDTVEVAGWIGSYGGEVGTPRLLDLFERLGIKTTWFIPGHSIETFPSR